MRVIWETFPVKERTRKPDLAPSLGQLRKYVCGYLRRTVLNYNQLKYIIRLT